MIALGSALGSAGYVMLSGKVATDFSSVLAIGVSGAVFYVLSARSAGLYGFPVLADASGHLGRIVTICGSVLLGLTAVLFLLKIGADFSRGAMLVFATVTLVLCCLTRVLASAVVDTLLEHNAIVGRAVYLFGDSDELASLQPNYLLRFFGLSEIGRSVLPDRDLIGDARWQAAVTELLDAARRSNAEELALAARADHLEGLRRIEQAVRTSPLPLRLMPNQVLRTILGRQGGTQPHAAHLLTLQRAPLDRLEQGIKRALDMAGATVGLLALAPLLVLAAGAVKLDSPGPIIFRQTRRGFNQKPFAILKFRTMHVLENGPSIVQASKADKRITRVGRILRRSSIDELPQLLNVLKGDMSLVGPRPHAVAHDDSYGTLIEEYCLRHHVKPGITGWAQVNGLRGETAATADMRRRVDHDVWYITNWSVRLDLKILVRTCLEVLRHEAY